MQVQYVPSTGVVRLVTLSTFGRSLWRQGEETTTGGKAECASKYAVFQSGKWNSSSWCIEVKLGSLGDLWILE